MRRSIRVLLGCFAIAGAAGSVCSCHTAALDRAGVATLSSATPLPVAVPSRPLAGPDGTFIIAGLHYAEAVSGGALENDTLPMIVLFHGMGMRPRMFAPVFARASARARFIFPFGFLPKELGFEWFEPRTASLGPAAQLDAALPAAVEQVATALNALRATRPTAGKIVIGGFSQGAELTYGLALLHPEMFARACPMAGALTATLLDRPRSDVPKPEVHGFHGGADPVVKTAAGQTTINKLGALGYAADLKIYPGVVHDFVPAIDDVSTCVQAGARLAASSL